MAREERSDSKRSGGHIQFSLTGFVALIVSLVLATGVLAYALTRPNSGAGTAKQQTSHDLTDAKPPTEVPAWGELITYDTQMERPEEYTAQEVASVDKPKWVFSGMGVEQIRQLMLASGFTADQTANALAAGRVSITDSNTIVRPDDALVFALGPDVRARFYAELGKDAANHYMQYPFCFPENSFDEIAAGGRIQPGVLANIRSLLYTRGNTQFLSDFEALMNRIPSQDQRLQLVKTLSSQSAVLARIRVRPDCDIDKLLGYWAWAPGVRFTNLRPLLESICRLEGGGTISLLYFLPQFARERLYTYPLPSQPNDPAMDCHWSTMNFFNDPPDNRFADPSYTVSYLTSHYYPVAKATRYGDRIFLLDDKGNAIHSAVYIADDIVFTKNGNNYMEPWMLMRMKKLLATYSANHSPRVVVYRSKDS
jgi:hypothetical protein